MSMNCPICNKAGLPDYTKESVVCSQCNSDLKAFLILRSVSTPQKSKFGTYIIIGISLFSITLLGLILKSYSEKKELTWHNELLNDSIAKMHNVIELSQEEKKQQPIDDKQDIIIKYVVKKGDYLYKIAQFFYNDGSKYKQIEEANDLAKPNTLKVGQILIIKISIE